MMLPLGSYAKKTNINYGKVLIAPQELSQKGDSLYVKMDIDMKGTTVKNNMALDITPILTDGKESVNLPEVTIKGRRQYKEYIRKMALSNGKEDATTAVPYAVVNGYQNNTTLKYDYVMPFEEWMAESHLDAKTDLCGCGDYTQQVAMQRLVDNVALEPKIVITPLQVIPNLAYVTPAVEPIKHRDVEDKAFLDFAVGKSVIRPEFGNNPTELMKIQKMMDGVGKNDNITIRSVSIVGYASPEGTYAFNQRLSEARANSMKNYLMSRYNIPYQLYHTSFGGEDWDGLVKLVEASNMEYKNSVLELIGTVDIFAGREAKIMKLAGGVPYRYMLHEMFPSLRRVNCKVDYDVRNFTIEETAEVFKTRPQDLSLNEMFMLANTYEKGSDQFNDVFETAVRLYPDNQTALLNAATAALARKDLVSAKKYLAKCDATTHEFEYDNAMGVMEMLKENYEKAETYLKPAAEAGLQAAKDNLQQVIAKLENIQQLAGQAEGVTPKAKANANANAKADTEADAKLQNTKDDIQQLIDRMENIKQQLEQSEKNTKK